MVRGLATKCRMTPTPPPRRVAIVGAGFAGLAAAHRLLVTAPDRIQVSIFEATAAVGGRARTGWLPTGGPVELGATWFHGTVGNPVYDLAVKYGVLTPAKYSRQHGLHQAARADQTAKQQDAQASEPTAAAATGTPTAATPAAAPDASAAASGSASISTGDDRADEDGMDDARWAMELCLLGASKSLTGQEKAAALEAFQQYSMAMAEIEAEAASDQQAVSDDADKAPHKATLGYYLRCKFDEVMAGLDQQMEGSDRQQQQLGEQQRHQGAVHGSPSGRLRSVFAQGWAVRERLQRAYDGFHSTDVAGLGHILYYEDLDGPNTPVPGGYQALAEGLAVEAKGLGLKLHLSTPISKVVWDRPDGKVALKRKQQHMATHLHHTGTEAAAETDSVLAADPTDSADVPAQQQDDNTELDVFDAVVFTGSVGVLKAQGSSLFEPHLPAAKCEAIQQLHIGQVEKVFIEWPAAVAAAVAAAADSGLEAGAVQGQVGSIQAGACSNEVVRQQTDHYHHQQQRRLTGAVGASDYSSSSSSSSSAAARSQTGQSVMHVVGPRKPKTQVHDTHASAAEEDVDSAAVTTRSTSKYTTYCLMWPTRTELWGQEWPMQQQQQQRKQQQQQPWADADIPACDPVYINCCNTADAPTPHSVGSSGRQQTVQQPSQQQPQGPGSVPEWLLGLHSWRYGDGPEWIKTPCDSSSSSSSSSSGGIGSQQQQHGLQEVQLQQQQEQQQIHGTQRHWLPHRSAVLWVTGRAALQLGQLEDQQVLQDIESLLDWYPAIPRPPKMAGSNAMANTNSSSGVGDGLATAAVAAGPENISSHSGSLAGCWLLRSNWSQNKYFRGSYSYPGPTATEQTVNVLLQPLTVADATPAREAGAAMGTDTGRTKDIRVCFAGEATSRQHMGTVHGAYISEMREAERLLQHWGLL